MTDRPHPPSSGRFGVAATALVLGALAMGASPVFVRTAEVAPNASAFWRVGLALPFLWAWARYEGRGSRPSSWWQGAVFVAGAMFAGDLFFWHLAIFNTTLANATLLAVLAPVWVALGSGLFLGEPVRRNVWIGLVLCVAGAFALVGASFTLDPARLFGDLCGLATSVFFGGYFLAVRIARRSLTSGVVLYRSSVVTAAILLAVVVVAGDRLAPATLGGWGALTALALVSHIGGQGLLAFALGHLTAVFSSLVIFLEAVFAAGFGYAVFGETLAPVQLLGGALILAGLWVARPRSEPQPAVAER